MNLNRLNPLPEWDELDLHPPESREEWKAEIEAAGALYNAWREVFGLVVAFCDLLPGEENARSEIRIETRHLIFESAFPVAPKIRSAAGDTLYEIKKEKAALIRCLCRQMKEQIAFGLLSGDRDIQEDREKERGQLEGPVPGKELRQVNAH